MVQVEEEVVQVEEEVVQVEEQMVQVEEEVVKVEEEAAKLMQVTPDPRWGEGIKHTIKLVDIGKNINVALLERNLTTDNEVQTPGTWCWHAHITAKSVKKYMFKLEDD